MNKKTPKIISAKDLHHWLLNKSPLPLLIDVREDEEIALAPFPGSILHLPLSKSSTWLDSLSERFEDLCDVVVICHSGIRSWNFVVWLIEQDWELDVWNLEGGIDAWSVDVDSTVPRY